MPAGLACAIEVYTGISLACQLRGENRGFPKCSSEAQRFHLTYLINRGSEPWCCSYPFCSYPSP